MKLPWAQAKPRAVEISHPYTVVLRAATEADKTALLFALDRALALLVREESDNAVTTETYRAIHAMLPQRPALAFASNVVHVAPEFWQRRPSV